MGTRVAVLDQGRIQQIDTPQRIYDEPANLFVATFIGSPAMNLLPGKLLPRSAGGYDVDLGTQTIGLGESAEQTFPGLPGQVGGDVVVGVRPEALADVAVEAGTPGDLTIEASVDLVESLGAELIVHVEVTGVKRARLGGAGGADDSDDDARQNGDSGQLTYDGRAVARLSTRSRLAQGDVLKLAIDPAGLHLFHPLSGASLRA